PREGKSTTVANLSVAFARSGKRVALVDLDLRQPFIHAFFASAGGSGITDVLAGRQTLSEALRPRVVPTTIAVTPGSQNGASTRVSRTGKRDRSVLNVLPSGTLAPASGDALAELLESEQLDSVFDELGEQFDLVLADTPPLLA